MRALTATEAEILRKVIDRDSRPATVEATQEEERAIPGLLIRGCVVAEPMLCSGIHRAYALHITPLGRLALRLHRVLLVVALVLLAVGCIGFVHQVERAPGAPTLAPSSRAPELAAAAPAGAVLLGTVREEGNATKTAGACEARLLEDARELGATVVVLEHAESGGAWHGPTCAGSAYATHVDAGDAGRTLGP